MARTTTAANGWTPSRTFWRLSASRRWPESPRNPAAEAQRKHAILRWRNVSSVMSSTPPAPSSLKWATIGPRCRRTNEQRGVLRVAAIPHSKARTKIRLRSANSRRRDHFGARFGIKTIASTLSRSVETLRKTSRTNHRPHPKQTANKAENNSASAMENWNGLRGPRRVGTARPRICKLPPQRPVKVASVSRNARWGHTTDAGCPLRRKETTRKTLCRQPESVPQNMAFAAAARIDVSAKPAAKPVGNPIATPAKRAIGKRGMSK